MVILGISLYIFWLLLVIVKFSALPRDRSFSYQQTFFGTLLWYKNFRNLLLLCSLFTLFIFAPLKVIYLLFLISSVLIFFMAARNFRYLIANPWVSLALCTVSLVTGIFAGLFVFRT